MPRKTKLSHDEIVVQAIESAARLAEIDGLRTITIRPIAKDVGCSVGTLYNVVGDLHDIILRLNARTTEGISYSMEQKIKNLDDPIKKAHALAEVYLATALENRNLWSVLFEYITPKDRPLPHWYLEILARPTHLVFSSLRPLFKSDNDCRNAVTILWSGLHGITSLALANKFWIVSNEEPRLAAKRMIDTYLKT